MNSNQKRIKLHGGPQDGAVVEVLHSLHEYKVPVPTGKPVDFSDAENFTDPSHEIVIYRETFYRSASGEVVFSIYDNMP